MSDEEALLLTLLDRPHSKSLRLVYADWLEEHGQDDLAQWQRLTVSSPQRGDTPRLRELRERHHQDWVGLGGLVVPWQSVLALFCRRLAETVAWCGEPAGKGLRTPELLPQAAVHNNGIEPLWRCRQPWERIRLTQQLGAARAARLSDRDLTPERPASDLAGGRLILFDPDKALADGRAGLYSGGFFDAYQAPPWDTWLFYLEDGQEGRRKAHAHWEAEWIVRRKVVPVAFEGYLVAWVPPPLVEAADKICQMGLQPSLEWAENVDCALTARLRELGWFRTAEPARAVARREQRASYLR